MTGPCVPDDEGRPDEGHTDERSLDEGSLDEGSLTVELVLMTPVVLFLALMVLAFGRVGEARQQVVEAARAGAESAAVLPTPAAARAGAAEAAVVGVFARGETCTGAQVTTDVSHFYPGGYVSVTVACQVGLADLAVPGLPGTTTVRATSTAPIDPYRSVQ
jgi:Flp pilus assembly protein TadG